jgi:hypothetical protein
MGPALSKGEAESTKRKRVFRVVCTSRIANIKQTIQPFRPTSSSTWPLPYVSTPAHEAGEPPSRPAMPLRRGVPQTSLGIWRFPQATTAEMDTAGLLG